MKGCVCVAHVVSFGLFRRRLECVKCIYIYTRQHADDERRVSVSLCVCHWRKGSPGQWCVADDSPGGDGLVCLVCVVLLGWWVSGGFFIHCC